MAVNETQLNETLAERWCWEANLDFQEVFRNQFIIVPSKADAIAGFIHTSLDTWHVYSGPDVPICHGTVDQDGTQVVMLGIAVDADGLVLSPGNFATKISGFAGFDAVVEDLLKCAGRYAFVVIGDGKARMYGDAGNTLGFVYNRNTGRVASSPHLAIKRRIIPNQEYPYAYDASMGKGPRFAFGYTADAHIYRPLANHFLDLTEKTTHRFWPTEDTNLNIDPSDEAAQEAALDIFIKRHQQVMQALTSAFTPAILPLSGGRETRILLASVLDRVDNVDLMFTHAANWMSLVDMAVARRLAKAAGRRLHEIYAKKMLGWKERHPTWKQQLEANKLAVGMLPDAKPEDLGRHVVTTALPKGGIVMRGYVSDLLKAVLWENGIVHYSNGLPHKNRQGLKMLFLTGNDRKKGREIYGAFWAQPWFEKTYAKWRATLPKSAEGRIYDLQFMEHFQAHGHGEVFYNFRDNFYIGPGNDRAVMEAAIALPPVERRDLIYHTRLYEKIGTELGDIPYNAEIIEMTAEERKKYHSALG